MKKTILFALILPILIISINDTFAAIPMPASQESYQYSSIVSPVVSEDPAQAKPVGVGVVAAGGDTLSLQVILGQFTGAVDIYFALYAPSIDPDNIYLLKSDYTFQPLSMGLVPWKQETIGSISENLFGDIPILLLTPSIYYVGLLVSPAGSGTSGGYYFWTTYFEISDTVSPSAPTGLTTTAVSSSQVNLSWNPSTDNVGVAGYKLYRGGSYIKSVATTSTSDSGLNSSTQYCYSVTAYDIIGNESVQSSQACAETWDTTPICTPSYVTVWPIVIDAQAGETKSATASVANNCGSAVNYTASVTSGTSWLSTQTSGTGSIQVTVQTTGMSDGTYTGTVRINPSGYSATDLLVTLNIAGQCNSSSAVVNPSTISKTITVGEQLQDINVTVKDNCSNSISYTVTDVSGSWISSPQVGYQNTGTLTLKFSTTSLSSGNYTGTVKLGVGSFGTAQIVINLSVTNIPPDAVLLKNFEIDFYSYEPGQIRYFYFYETGNKGQGNKYSLIVSQMDMYPGTGLYNIDMIVKYAGPFCEYGKPTMADYNSIKQGEIKTGQDNFYFRLSADAFETVEIYPPNPEGCYYVMVINADTVKEPKISIKYEDTDSYSGQ